MLISFTQIPTNSSYKYILRSTRKWKKELEKSTINVILPASFNFESNYSELAQVNSDDTISEFSMIKNQFYPDKDLFINWTDN